MLRDKRFDINGPQRGKKNVNFKQDDNYSKLGLF
jgi:hypothetical protein